MRPKHNFHFPWRAGNHFELLVDGVRFYPAMLAAIADARAYVLLEMYLAESGMVADRFIDALTAAAGRGVTVKLLLDGFGALKLNAGDRERLTAAGVEMSFYNQLRAAKLVRNLARDHRKLLLVDGRIAFVGGAGLTDEFDPPEHSERRWRETMVSIQGPIVADWQRLFVEVWTRAGARLDLAPVAARTFEPGMRGRVDITQAPRRHDITRALLKYIRAAERRVWIETAYFIPPWRVRRALGRAARRGVDVRVLLPGPYTDHPAVRHAGRRFYGPLLRHGVRIFEYQPRFLHSKTALCDQWVSVGSSNFDRWNMRWNLEANQSVDDPGFAAAVAAMFEQDFRAAAECEYEQWRRRPWSERVRQYAWGKVDLWLDALVRDRGAPGR